MQIASNLASVRVWSQHFDHARKFADQASAAHSIRVTAVDTVKEAVAGVDIICTVTSATEPILQSDWISPGTHINAVGSSVAFARELDTATVVKSKLFVDRRESTLNEAGDFLFPKKEGAIGDDHIRGEIGDILLDRIEGRTSPEEITLFKSLGLAAEDVAAAHYIYQQLVNNEEGMWVAFGALKSE
jgi:ornithine cyclodeaminase